MIPNPLRISLTNNRNPRLEFRGPRTRYGMNAVSGDLRLIDSGETVRVTATASGSWTVDAYDLTGERVFSGIFGDRFVSMTHNLEVVQGLLPAASPGNLRLMGSLTADSMSAPDVRRKSDDWANLTVWRDRPGPQTERLELMLLNDGTVRIRSLSRGLLDEIIFQLGDDEQPVTFKRSQRVS